MTRAELYELIWNEPMTRVAARLGVSNVALRRICDRNDIPRPRPGHWSKLAYGKGVVDRPPLSSSQFDNLDKIRMPAGSNRSFSGILFALFAAVYMLQATEA